MEILIKIVLIYIWFSITKKVLRGMLMDEIG